MALGVRLVLASLATLTAACVTLDSGLYVGVAAVDSRGRLDPEFGSGGISLLYAGRSAHPCGEILRGGIGVNSQRQIVTAGCADDGFIASIRSETGSAWPRFGLDGVLRGPGGAAQALAVARAAGAPDSGFFAAGQTTRRRFPGDNDVRIVAYDLLGFERTFAGSGSVTTDFGADTTTSASGIAIDADGKIIVGASIRPGLVALARYGAGGALDPTFGTGGLRVRDRPIGWRSASVGGVAIDTLGRIVVGGHYGYQPRPGVGENAFFVTRFSANGNPDARFGRFGIASTDLPPISGEHAYDVETLPDNRIVLCGSQPSNPFDISSVVYLLRYDDNGLLDPSFDGDGIVAFEWPRPRLSNCLALDVLERNALLVTGYADETPDTAILLSRFRADGAIDTTYGTGGATEITRDDICAAHDCPSRTRRVSIHPGGLDTIVFGGRSYTHFFVIVEPPPRR